MADVFDYIHWRGDISFTNAPFCEVDALIFSKLSYLPFEYIVPHSVDRSITLSEASDEFFAINKGRDVRLGEIIPDEIVDLFALCAQSVRFGNIPLSAYRSISNEERGEQFSAVTFLLDNGVNVVTYRGTDDTLIGWKEDFTMAFQTPIPAQYSAERYLAEIGESFDGEIIINGHSKGGNLSYWAALTAPLTIRERIVAVYNLDGPGFINDIRDNTVYQELHDRMKTIVPTCSVVGMFFNYDDNYEVVESTERGVFQHNGLSWKVLGNKFVRADDFTDECKRINSLLGAWIDSMSKSDREAFVDAVFDVLASTKAQTLTDLAADKAGVIKAFSSLDEETKRALSVGIKLLIGEGRASARQMLGVQSKDDEDSYAACAHPPKAKLMRKKRIVRRKVASKKRDKRSVPKASGCVAACKRTRHTGIKTITDSFKNLEMPQIDFSFLNSVLTPRRSEGKKTANQGRIKKRIK